MQHWLPPFWLGTVVALSVPAGWWACTVTARNLRIADPGAIVWDEVACFWIVLWLLMPAGLPAQAAAFVLFRFFDMVKPGPVGWADRHFKGHGWVGGFGIMMDDLVAAFCTLLVIAFWRHWW
jgi:phosphatidylglycerophosphatase A